jgi:hypothetical protein
MWLLLLLVLLLLQSPLVTSPRLPLPLSAVTALWPLLRLVPLPR